jgi:protein-S-isoprenylcysteine O-methyltransferase Ste14
VDPIVFRDSTAQAVAVASAAPVVVREWALQWRTRRTRHAASDRGTYWTLAIALGGAFYVAARAPDWAPGLSLSGGARWPFLVGVAVFWAGAALRWWAIATLGRFFQLTVVVQEGQSVVDRGPYKVLRHPSYTGALLIFLGIGFACDNALSVLACLVLPGVAFLRRIHVEEAVLTRELGEPYRAYARRTRRLIPGVW